MQLGDVVLGEHGRENDVSTLLVIVIVRRVAEVSRGGVLHNRQQAGSFCGSERFCGLSEVPLRGRLNAVCISTKRSDVEVGLQDLVFREALFQSDREFHLVEFAVKVSSCGLAIGLVSFLLSRQIQRTLHKDVFHQLHGERRGPGFNITGQKVSQRRPHKRRGINTGVLVEPPILSRHSCRNDVRTHFFQRDFLAVLPIDLGNSHIPIGRVLRARRPERVLFCLLTNIDVFRQSVKHTNRRVRGNTGHRKSRRHHCGGNQAGKCRHSGHAEDGEYPATPPRRGLSHSSRLRDGP